MDRLTARRLFQQVKALAAQLFDVRPDDVQAYILVIVTLDDKILESTNMTDNSQISALLARCALSTRPHVPHVRPSPN